MNLGSNCTGIEFAAWLDTCNLKLKKHIKNGSLLTDQTVIKESNAWSLKTAINHLLMEDKLNVLELMEVKGGIMDKSQICIAASAVKCTAPGSGVIVGPPTPPPTQPTNPPTK